MATSLHELVGNTPLVSLERLAPELAERGVVAWAKAEHLNPSGSVKDRIAIAMIEAAERDGRLRPGATVVEATSGNTGIALALVCARTRHPLVLTMPESMSLERRSLLQALGARVELTEAESSMQGALDRANALLVENPSWFMPRQFENPVVLDAHRATGAEIVAQLDRAPSVFVAGVGTGGTVSGVGAALKARFPDVRVVAVEPATSQVLAGGVSGPHRIQGIGPGFVPAHFDRSVVDEVRAVDDRAAWAMKQRLATDCGLLVGISSGANVAVALQLAAGLPDGAQAITILCDTGERYFSLGAYFP